MSECSKCGKTIDKKGFTRCTSCIRSYQNSARKRNKIYSEHLESQLETYKEFARHVKYRTRDSILHPIVLTSEINKLRTSALYKEISKDLEDK